MTNMEIFPITFGGLYFAGHLVWAAVNVLAAKGRDARLVEAGIFVPGFAGLFMVFAVIARWPILKIALRIAALVIGLVGRALYELVVFRSNGSRR